MSERLFRKAALERLSSPEQLDRMVTVTGSKTWSALIMICAMVAAIVFWSIYGSIPTRVDGQGILINSGGRVIDVQSTGSGNLAEILVSVGDHVEAGQVVARLSQTQAETSHQNALAIVSEREFELGRIQSQNAVEFDVKKASFDRRRIALESRIAASQQQVDYLTSRLADLERLLTAGTVTRDVVNRARDEANRAAQELADTQGALILLEAEELDLIAALENRERMAADALSDARRNVSQIEVTLSRSSTVTAPAAGRVTEIKTAPGALVGEGQSLFSFQSGDDFLELNLYISPMQGKRVEPGMRVQISPSTARREEFGTVYGIVDWVSEFPVTIDGMRSMLQNDDLARTFSAGGPPYLARVRLEADPDTISGYRWSSARGESMALSGGTLASGEITVSEQAPISLVIPLLREFTGMN